MTTAVQHRRGTTAEHAAFTGLEGEVTIDTTKDTAVIHDGTLAGGYPLAKENLANVTTSGLSSIDGASTASDDKFFIFDQSATSLKTITRAELNNAIEQDALANVAITGGTINGTAIGGTTPAAGAFTTLSASGAATLSGLTASTALALDGSKNIVSVTNTGTGSNVLATSPTLVTPALGTPSSATLTNATGLPISTGVSGLGTGIATALALNVGSAGAPVVLNGALGTPSSGTVTNLTGTASININGTVGATTASTGAFTTLAASGAVTLSGGTANGVAYLNGSKVVTSGSALTFDGTNLGIAASSPTSKLHIGGNTASTQQAIFSTGVTDSDFKVVARNGVSGATAVQGYIGLDYANGTWPLLAGMQFIRNSTSGELAFTAGATTSASEQMRLTSTGLGIGTSSPSAKLQVNGGEVRGVGTGFFYSGYQSNGTTRTFYLGGSDSAFYLNVDANAPIYIANNGTVRATIDTSGNLGLGVTPSAWGSSYKALQFPSGTYGGGSFITDSGSPAITANAYNNAGWKYVGSDYATIYQSRSGQHQWFTAASGTAGTAITFTQAMTLTAAGNLGIGTSSPLAKLDSRGNAIITTNANGDNVLAFGNTSVFGGALSGAPGGSYGNAFIVGECSTGSGAPGFLKFYTTTSGSVSERARIDSSGNLLVGATSQFGGADCKLQGKNGSSAQAVSFLWNATTTGDANFVAFGTEATVTQRGSITYNRAGGLTAYNTTSDYRAKDISGPVTGSGALIDSVPVYMGKMKGATQERPMFIAHETPAYAHTGEKDAVDTDGNPVYQQMDASALIPVMWAEIQSLRKRLADAGL